MASYRATRLFITTIYGNVVLSLVRREKNATEVPEADGLFPFLFWFTRQLQPGLLSEIDPKSCRTQAYKPNKRISAIWVHQVIMLNNTAFHFPGFKIAKYTPRCVRAHWNYKVAAQMEFLMIFMGLVRLMLVWFEFTRLPSRFMLWCGCSRLVPGATKYLLERWADIFASVMIVSTLYHRIICD